VLQGLGKECFDKFKRKRGKKQEKILRKFIAGVNKKAPVKEPWEKLL